MAKKSGIIFVISGAVLILSALSLVFYNRYSDRQAGSDSQLLLEAMQAAMAEQQPQPSAEPEPSDSPELPQATLSPEMPVMELDGYEYIGYLSIPALDMELPVMSDWDYKRLKIAPCRHFGSTRTNDLVIAAHNFTSHFGELKDIEPGETVIFTETEQTVYTYVIEKTEILQPDQVAEVQNSGYDLVLYTCTRGGRTRVVVFCSRVEDE